MVAQPMLSNSEARGLTDADMVLEDLAEQTDAVRKRAAELLAGFARMPSIIDDRKTAELAAAFAKQLGEHEAIVEDWRKKEKGKWDAIASAVQRFLKPLVDDLDAAKRAVNARILAFDQAERRKAEQERQAAIDAARKAQAEAEKIAATAQTDADLDRAIAQETVAQANMVTAASIEAPKQIRSTDYGVTASVRKTVTYRISDETALPRHLLMPNEAAIKALVKTAVKGHLPAPVPGIEWGWNEMMVSR